MKAVINLSDFHKNQIYKENLVFESSEKMKNNLGTSVLEVTFILRSDVAMKSVAENYNSRDFMDISQKLLDYDL